MLVSPVAVSVKPGNYPSKLYWSLLGIGIGVYILYRDVHGPSYAIVIVQWRKRSWAKGNQRRVAKGALIRRRKAEMKEEKPGTATRARGMMSLIRDKGLDR